MKSKQPILRKTKNYNLFEPHPFNRNITRTKILEQSMECYGYDPGFPMRCVENGNGKLRITHGHHRFHVARQLKLPVWYIIAPADISLFESEASSHSWDVRDFTVARARAGDDDANSVLQYHKQTGIPLQACISLVGGEGASSGNKSRDMKLGKFKARNESHSIEVATIVNHCKSLGITFATNAYFVNAISKCLFVPEFDMACFMNKVSAHTSLMEPRRDVYGYLELIELIYNRLSHKKVPMAFLAKETASQRKATFGGKIKA